VNRTRKAQIVVLVVLVALVVAFFLMRPPDLEAQAREMVWAALNNDPDTIYAYAPEHEIRECRLTRDKWRQVWRELIQPRIQGFERPGEINSHLEPNHQGLAEIELQYPSGVTARIGVACFAGDSKCEYPALNFLVSAWLIEYQRKHRLSTDDLTNVDRVRAWLEGIRADKERMKELGIPGRVEEDPAVPLKAWDKSEENCLLLLQQVEQEHARSTAPTGNGGE